MDTRLYIGIMSGTSMDGADAVLIAMKGGKWAGAKAHSFLPYPDSLREALLDLQHQGANELHRSMMLSQTLSRLYADTVRLLLAENGLRPSDIAAVGCHGQTVRHAPEHGYSIQLSDLPLLAHLTQIFTVGDFRSRDLAAGGQGAPLVPAFHEALFRHDTHTRAVLNIGGIANISILPPDAPAFGFDTGPGNMLMDAWMREIWHLPYDKNGERAASGKVLPDLLHALCAHPYFSQPHPKSTGRELFSIEWLHSYLDGSEQPADVLRTLVRFSAETVCRALEDAAADARQIYVCGGGIRNPVLMADLQKLSGTETTLHSTAELRLDPQWVEAAAFAWLAACWLERIPSNPHHATGASKPCILGAGHYY